MAEKILAVLTGGTICSFENKDGKRDSDTKKAEYIIIENFRKSGSPFADTEFDCDMPLDILSENMTLGAWNILLAYFRKKDFSAYKGVIVLHGTDTLAYTAAMLSLMLTHMEIPVILVSAKLPLGDKNTNGNRNFRAAAELIMKGIAPDVYAVYENSGNNMLIHYGAHLMQCVNFSDDFHSADEIPVESFMLCKPFFTKNNFLFKAEDFAPEVLYISPYTGIDYSHYSLNGVKAVLLGTYHSETLCSDKELENFIKKCTDNSVPVFLSPCSSDAYAYVSTGKALSFGAHAAGEITAEAAYAKLLLGLALGKNDRELVLFMNENINNEK